MAGAKGMAIAVRLQTFGDLFDSVATAIVNGVDDATNQNATNNPVSGGLRGFPADVDTPAREHELLRVTCREWQRSTPYGCEQ